MSSQPKQKNITISSSSREVIKTTASLHPLRDRYYWLLSLTWYQLFILLGVSFLIANLIFACLYFLIDGLNVSPLLFFDSFFFSVHTIATVGYGSMYPVSLLANIVVMFEIMVGIAMLAMTTGLMFAKFSRPTAKLLFSKIAVINQRNSKPTFSFRVANQRGNHVVSAKVHVLVLRPEVTQEGEKIRKQHDLVLERSETPLFVLSWSVFHTIDENSVLFEETAESFREKGLRIIVSVIGYDSVLAQEIHAQYIYDPEHILWGVHFKDALTRLPDETLDLDQKKFHEVEAL